MSSERPEEEISSEHANRLKQNGLKQRLWELIFEAESPSGKIFDVALLWLIILSVFVVMLESVESLEIQYKTLFLTLEWIFTILFSIEYLLRLWLVRKPLRYACSFFGIIDLLSCLPTYLTLFGLGVQSLLVVRLFRLLRMFRVLKMVNHVQGANLLLRSLYASRAKVTVFLLTMAIFATIAGTLAYLLEHDVEGNRFTSIPVGIYWAIVTMTTLGYGDVVPVTVAGKVLTAITSLSGFAIIAVPTGIVSAELSRGREEKAEFTEACPGCGANGHLPDAKYCRKCGEKLDWRG